MKKYSLLPLLCCVLLTACNTASPEKYFDVAVLNTNMISGFGGDALERELQSPSGKLVEGTKDQVAPMKRSEVINDKIQFVADNLEKVKQLKETPETKDILQTSIALHEFVLPVYKTEYTQLAGLYDQNASKEQIESLKETLHQKYSSRFEELFTAVTNAGKIYAVKNNIKVNWGN